MSLQEKLASLKVEARKALEEGDLENGRKFREEAESVAEAIEELQKLDNIKTAEPVRPPLPMMGNGNLPAPDPVEPAETPAQMVHKAAYQTKFGDTGNMVKSLLTSLHGHDYVSQYWAQKAAFNKYLRVGLDEMDSIERKAMRSMVYTPAAIKDALAQGIYDVKTLKATMVEGSDVLGGYAVPIDFNSRVIERMPGFTMIRPWAFKLTTGRDMVSIPVSTGGDDQYTSAVRVTWVDETPAAAASETNLTFGMENIAIHTVMATTPISRNMLEDAFFDVEDFLATKYAEAAGIDEDNRFLTSAGGASPLGILPGSANTLSLTEEDTGNANLLTWDGAGAAVTKRGLIGLVYAIASQYLPRARWLMERATVEYIRTMKDGAGNYLWEPDQQAGQPLMLLGYPVYMQEAMPSIAADAYPILFGDFGGYYIADRVGMTVERFLGGTEAELNTVKFVMRRRLGGQLVETYKLAAQKVSA